MHYLSTRAHAPAISFEQTLLAGLAVDGGLYMPSEWPQFTVDDIASMRGLTYAELTARIIERFVGDGDSNSDNAIDLVQLSALCNRAYKNFDDATIAPLKPLGDSLYVLELFHGPTLAFKDFALQLLGQLFAHYLTRQRQTRTIIGATSGDTGSAAICALRGLDAVTLFMLHPHGRVSEVQRRQMTTVQDANIINIAVDGVFDDCQNLVKALFNDAKFREQKQLAAVNSINWVRIAAQTAYYFYAAIQLGAPQRKVNFAVPSGNFGNVFAGWVARAMGLPINRLIIGSNRNDILTRFFQSGKMQQQQVAPTISPSMDIQISGNFERYLFELLNRDGAQLTKLMQQFTDNGKFEVDADALRDACELFTAHRFTDQQTKDEIARTYQDCNELLDPHSAIGVAAARAFIADEPDSDTPTVALATAHPAKFPDAVFDACGVHPPLPERLRAVMQGEEKMIRVANDYDAVKEIIAAT